MKIDKCLDTLIVGAGFAGMYILHKQMSEGFKVEIFEQADDVLAIAAKGIAEVISVTGQINVDFNDVNTVMKDSGVAIMGSAEAEGDDRATKCVEQALSSPLSSLTARCNDCCCSTSRWLCTA